MPERYSKGRLKTYFVFSDDLFSDDLKRSNSPAANRMPS
nr:MAG TPA: hypothetical protein [Caudoviricetes sp.]